MRAFVAFCRAFCCCSLAAPKQGCLGPLPPTEAGRKTTGLATLLPPRNSASCTCLRLWPVPSAARARNLASTKTASAS
eukprot:1153574-Lingulodinium_polyedra.AAC.1